MPRARGARRRHSVDGLPSHLSEGEPCEHQPHGRPRARRLCRRVVLGAGHRGAPGARRAGARAAEPAAGPGPRRGVHRQLRQPDRRAGAAGRPLLRRCRHLRRRRQHAQRGRAGLRRGVRARRGRVVRRDLRRVRRHAAGRRRAPEPVPARGWRDGRRADDRSGALPRGVRGRPVGGRHADVLAVMQRPFAAIFEDRAQAAAWKTLPSWAVVATADNAIPPDAERHMARRAGAETDRGRRLALDRALAAGSGRGAHPDRGRRHLRPPPPASDGLRATAARRRCRVPRRAASAR